MKKRVLNSEAEVKKRECFVIMPFEPWSEQYYEKIFEPAIKKAGLHPCKINELHVPKAIVQDMFEHTKKATVILVDLTGGNPNVFYELGLAHALDIPTILIMDSNSNIPFDIKHFRTIIYDKNEPTWGKSLGTKIYQSLEEVLANPNESKPSHFLTGKSQISDDQNESLILLQNELRALQRNIYLQTHNSLSPSYPNTYSQHQPRIDLNNAKELISRYVKKKMPRSFIINTLRNYGLTTNWILEQIHIASRSVR